MLGVALTFGLLGNSLGEPFVSRISVIFALAALLFVIAGLGHLCDLALPLMYLFLMVPPPYVLVKKLSYYLGMFDAIVTTEALQVIGVPVYRVSYFLNLPTITLESRGRLQRHCISIRNDSLRYDLRVLLTPGWARKSPSWPLS